MKLNKKAVLALIEQNGSLLSAKQLRGLLGLSKGHTSKLKAWLHKQVKRGSLVQQGNRFGSARMLLKSELAPSRKPRNEEEPRGKPLRGFARTGIPTPGKGRLSGTFVRNPRGFGFISTGDGHDDVFVGEGEQLNAMDGDRVEFELLRARGARGKRKGRIVRVLERSNSRMLATLHRRKSTVTASPINENLSFGTLRIRPEHDAPEAKHGSLVEVELIPESDGFRGGQIGRPLARIVRTLEGISPNELAFQRILQENQIRSIYPEEALRHADAFPTRILHDARSGRVDQRQLGYVTIDGKTARDFDDAVHAEHHPDGTWTLYVAIADVAHYVQPGDPVDQEAHARATSVYFPTHAIPMLPEALSNNLCSLRPEVNRLALTCEMHLNAEGQRTGYRIYESVIRSAGRLTYEDVEEVLQGRPSAIRSPQIQERLRQMNGLARILAKRREDRGALQFTFAEETVELDAENRMTGMGLRMQNDAMKLIEQFMLEANETVAQHCVEHKLPALYRVHEQPDFAKLSRLQRTFWRFGIEVPMSRLREPQGFNELFTQLRELPNQEQLQVLLLRCMALAIYQPSNLGHFGLAAEYYCHFTSPIRRYPDLTVHRALKQWIASTREGSSGKRSPRWHVDEGLGEHCSIQERRAEKAEQQSVDMMKVAFLEPHAGEGFRATVKMVDKGGMRILLEPHRIDWFIPVDELRDDWYAFNEEALVLQGKRRKRIIEAGKQLEVRLLRTNVLERTMEFEIVRWHS